MSTLQKILLTSLILALNACNIPNTEAGSPPPESTTESQATPESLPAANSELINLWVDPQNGSDSNDGLTPTTSLKTLDAAWQKIPQEQALMNGYTIHILPGALSAEQMPNYWEYRQGTPASPITILAENGLGSVTLTGGINMFEVQYLTLQGLQIIPEPAGDVFHCERCQHITIKESILNGRDGAQETVKINQSQHISLINNEISGAYDNAIDFVAVQFGEITGNRIHNAQDWCAYAKGGPAYLIIQNNEIFNCGTGGFTAGQGTGFQFMSAPWLNYEAYDIKVINNVIHDTEGAGLGVNGGYNILLAYNTLYKVGSRSHVIEVVYGLRSCDGQPGDEGRERCQEYLQAGGWGTTAVDDGTNAINIGNKNVYIFNNLIYNPTGFRSEYQHFAIYGPRSNPSESGLPLAVTDDNLLIKGNVIWNGDANMPLGIEGEDGCQPSSSTCNANQLMAENAINQFEPYLTDPENGNFSPLNGWAWASVEIPDFNWDMSVSFGDVPAGNTSNHVSLDFNSNPRLANGLPGAFIK